MKKRLSDTIHEFTRHKVKCASEHADFKRVVGWIADPKRKRAVIEFTSGPERAIGYAVDALEQRLREELQ